LDLLGAWRRRARESVRGHVTVTGGEPFARRDFLDLLDVFVAHKDDFSFAILTNGSFIDINMANRLHDLGPSFVQVSIEGTESTHDAIRGRGNFRRTVEAIRYLVRARICTMISFTAHRGNFREFPEVARLGRKLRVARVWADRLIPWGSGSALREQVLTPDETREFVEIMRRARARSKRFRFLDPTEIAMHRSLQFLAGGRAYHCTAGDSLITVQPNGDLLPCRRMPIRVGNLMERPLAELYYTSDLFKSLRDSNRISGECRECSFAGSCRGGLKCLSYALTGDPFQADPGCWLASGVAHAAVSGSSASGR
jgi:radical SAM protein with 4Fe4S-binding SPASM domain